MPQLHDGTSYKSNPLLKPVNTPYAFTAQEAAEYAKCSKDPIYFIENYVKVVHPDHGLVLMKLFPYQKDMVLSFWKNRKTICLTARQAGKSTVVAAFFVWYTIFNDEKKCALLANKAIVAREILARYQKAYENVPKFLQQGVVTFNKGSVELENGSTIMAASTTSSAIRGFTINVMYLDEFAFVPHNVAEDFFTSVWPTLSSSTKSKMIITSTPNGFNHFYKLWHEAKQNLNEFHPIFVHWSSVPGRDEKWKKEQLAMLGEDKFAQEMDAEFLGSSNTLIPSRDIKKMAATKPKYISDGLKIYSDPIKKDPLNSESFDHTYVIVCDPARGTGNDSSAFLVFDVSVTPMRIAAVYADPDVSPLVLPTILDRIAKTYNNAYVLVEINDNGGQVVDILWRDLEYENTIIFGGFGSKKANYGVKTTKSVKRQGCTLFKDMVSGNQVLIEDIDLISEISTFVRKNESYRADSGAHDDLVMCCVLFSWFATTQEYQNLTDTNYKKAILEQNLQRIQEDILPFGFIADGVEEPDQETVDFWGPGDNWF